MSGWEDSNFRPPRPERGALANCATPRSSVLAGTRTLDPLIKSQLLYQLSYQDSLNASSYEYCVLRAFGLVIISNYSLRTPGGTWTHTPLRARDFKSLVSTIPPPEHPCTGLPASIGDLSGKRDSNSRPRPWQGRALPTELFPHFIIKISSISCLKSGCKSTNFFPFNKTFFE